MPLLNYTTGVDAQKSIAEIMGMLARAKSIATMTEYDGFGNVSAISFKVKTAVGVLAFRLPGDVSQVAAALGRQKLAARFKTPEQARNVAWRIKKDWLEAQLAIVECGMAALEQVMLPYVQNESGETLYETLRARKFSGLALPETAAQ